MLTRKTLQKRMIDLDLNESRLAGRIGVSRPMLNKVLTGKLQTPWLRREVAKVLGYTYEAAWGTTDPGTPRGARLRLHSATLPQNTAARP